MDDYQDYLNQVFDILSNYFDEDELNTLCFKLGIDFNKFQGNGVEAKVRELLKYLDRHQRLLETVKQGKQERPTIDWPLLPRLATK